MSEGKIAASIRRVLDVIDEDHEYIVEGDAFVVPANCGEAVGRLNLRVHALEDAETAFFVASFEEKGDVSNPAQIGALIELVGRVNTTLTFGFFKIDATSGDLAYSCALCCAGVDEIPDDLIETGFTASIVFWEVYAPAFRAVIAKGKSPKEALDDVV